MHRLCTHFGTVTADLMPLRMSHTVFDTPGEPYRTDRFVRCAAIRSGNPADCQCHLCTAVLQRTRHHFAHRRFAYRTVLLVGRKELPPYTVICLIRALDPAEYR